MNSCKRNAALKFQPCGPARDSQLLSLFPDQKLAIGDYKEIAIHKILEDAADEKISINHKYRVLDLKTFPNDNLAAVCSDHAIRIWELPQQNPKLVLQAREGMNSLIAFSDGKLATGDRVARFSMFSNLLF